MASMTAAGREASVLFRLIGVGLERLAQLRKRHAGPEMTSRTTSAAMERNQRCNYHGIVVADARRRTPRRLGHDAFYKGVADPGHDRRPPFSRTTWGTTLEQMRLCRTVEPGYLSSMARATMAVVVDPLTGSPLSSTKKQRSASRQRPDRHRRPWPAPSPAVAQVLRCRGSAG